MILFVLKSKFGYLGVCGKLIRILYRYCNEDRVILIKIFIPFPNIFIKISINGY